MRPICCTLPFLSSDKLINLFGVDYVQIVQEFAIPMKTQHDTILH